jgi:hypothetical protein
MNVIGCVVQMHSVSLVSQIREHPPRSSNTRSKLFVLAV